jgi:hypothetical protein
MLEAIAAWELDAALESPQRYMLRTDAIARVAAGDASVVIGARGAGKTAASRLIVAQSSPDRPAARIALRDAFLAAMRPIADIESRARASASARYLMLLAAFEALLAEQILQGSEIRGLARELAVGLDPPIREALPHAFSKGLLFEIFGEGAQLKGDVESRILSLEHAVANALGRRRALVLFDETADSSVVAGAFDPLRVDALRILLKGARDLETGPTGGRLSPVVFTRPGLYARVPEQERAEWRGRTLNLVWTSRELRAVTAHRLARSRPASAGGSSDGLALQRFLTDAGRGPPMAEPPSWSTIWTRTRARPRDMVFLIRAIVRNARHRGLRRIDGEALRLGEMTYAAWLRQDIADEIRDVAPDVDDLLAAIARLGKRRLSAQELADVIERTLTASHAVEEAVAGARAAMERFFEASAIGNWRPEGGRGGRDVFVHDDPEATLDYHAPVAIHPGLASALGLGLVAAA